jgi:hypothetical protein
MLENKKVNDVIGVILRYPILYINENKKGKFIVPQFIFMLIKFHTSVPLICNK